MAEDHLAAPVALEEHRKLAVFAGEWTGEETVFPSRWTAGGAATSKVSARIDLNGFYLIRIRARRATARRPSPPTACHLRPRRPPLQTVLARFARLLPPSPASGGWSGKSLILVRGSLRGNARHVYEVIDDNSYSMKVQFSPEAAGWADVLTGVYRRVH